MKLNIKNRYNQDIYLLLNKVPDSKGLALLQHGASGCKEQSHLQTMSDAFISQSISTIIFDSRHSFNESYGELEELNLKTHSDDLEDVINWASSQDWYIEPFYLVAHSLGGASILNYLFKNPDKVKAIAPTSSVLEGKLYTQAKGKSVMKDWKEKGYREKRNFKNPQEIGKITYQYYKHIENCDFISGVENFTNIPLLTVVGSKDKPTPPEHQKILFDRWGCSNKIYHEIENCGHTFNKPEHLAELKDVMTKWIKSVEKT